MASRSEVDGDQGTTLVTVENASRSLAFFVHLKMMKSSRTPESPRTEILPVLWQDNYFPLMPGEKRQIAAAYAKADAGRGVPTLDVEGWNVIPETGIASNAASVPN